MPKSKSIDNKDRGSFAPSPLLRLIVAFSALVFCSWMAILKEFPWTKMAAQIKNSSPFSAHATTATADLELEQQQPPIHIYFGLAGNNPQFFGEFKAALKSILLSVPHHRDTHIHLIANQAAYDYLPTVWTEIRVDGIEWWRNVTIIPYNVEPQLHQWAKTLKNATNMELHGAYYRLFADKVLPTNVEYALYLDVDVAVLANLNYLFQKFPDDLESLKEKPVIVMAGGMEGGCSGVMMVHIAKLDSFWESVNAMNWTGRHLGFSDQSVINEVGKDYPDTVSYFGTPWDLTVTEHWREVHRFTKFRPEVGIIHYNGGAGHDPFYKSDFVNRTQHEVGLPAIFFRDLPWTWLRFMGKSAGGSANTGVRIQGRSNDTVILRHPVKTILQQSEYQEIMKNSSAHN